MISDRKIKRIRKTHRADFWTFVLGLHRKKKKKVKNEDSLNKNIFVFCHKGALGSV